MADVRVEAAVYVREMAASHVPVVVRAWQAISAWMVRGFQVVIDDDDLATLRALDRDHALIFLISHRSYLDQFSFPPRLTQEGISPTFGLAGANLNFFPLGTLARRNGFVPVRRATGDLPVYRLALRALVGQMVASGAQPGVVDRRRPDTHRQTTAATIRIAAVCDRRGPIRGVGADPRRPGLHHLRPVASARSQTDGRRIAGTSQEARERALAAQLCTRPAASPGPHLHQLRFAGATV